MPQFSVVVRNARGNAKETAIGTAPILKIREGAMPANCAAADAGNVLAQMTLPNDWMTEAVDGVKEKSGTWSDLSANLSGIAGHYRIYESTGTTCHEQGTITVTNGGGDLTVATLQVVATQPVEITALSQREGNA